MFHLGRRLLRGSHKPTCRIGAAVSDLSKAASPLLLRRASGRAPEHSRQVPLRDVGLKRPGGSRYPVRLGQDWRAANFATLRRAPKQDDPVRSRHGSATCTAQASFATSTRRTILHASASCCPRTSSCLVRVGPPSR